MDKETMIKIFNSDSNFFMVKFDSKQNQEFGKIINNISEIDLDNNEIHRSINYKNGNKLFVYDLKPSNIETIDSSLQLIINNLDEARAIEMVYPNIFRWAFDGVSIKAYAIVPSGDFKSNSTISRYGGTEMFIKILRQHLENIGKMNKGITPDYNFIKNKKEVNDTEISVGSINLFNKMYSVGITTNMSYIDVLKNSKLGKQSWNKLNILDIKYWAREINPDFITEAKHIKLNNFLSLDMEFKHYPPCIKNISSMKNKGNYYRFLLARFLLSAHKRADAKFVYYTVLGEEEREHIKQGNCSSQWNYILNNQERYSCPTCSEMKRFCDRKCKLVHPLEHIQKEIENEQRRINKKSGEIRKEVNSGEEEQRLFVERTEVVERPSRPSWK